MIDNQLQQNLREEFNPEGSELRKLQLGALSILLDIDKFCRKHQIQSWSCKTWRVYSLG